eukprot:SAG11_NODE_713_length_7636_cov_3.456415_3_plen_129_part_00
MAVAPLVLPPPAPDYQSRRFKSQNSRQQAVTSRGCDGPHVQVWRTAVSSSRRLSVDWLAVDREQYAALPEQWVAQLRRKPLREHRTNRRRPLRRPRHKLQPQRPLATKTAQCEAGRGRAVLGTKQSAQ